MIGRFVEVTATPQRVVVSCQGHIVAEHRRSWAKQAVVTDPAHVELAGQMRRDLARHRATLESRSRQHTDGHQVQLRALPDYDALFGVDFTPTPTPADSTGKETSQ